MSASTTYIVKRQGKRPTEAFKAEKLHASIVAVCLSVQAPIGQAEATASSVCNEVTVWLDEKPEVTSEDLRRKAAIVLEKYHQDAAHLYKHHHMVI